MAASATSLRDVLGRARETAGVPEFTRAFLVREEVGWSTQARARRCSLFSRQARSDMKNFSALRSSMSVDMVDASYKQFEVLGTSAKV